MLNFKPYQVNSEDWLLTGNIDVLACPWSVRGTEGFCVEFLIGGFTWIPREEFREFWEPKPCDPE